MRRILMIATLLVAVTAAARPAAAAFSTGCCACLEPDDCVAQTSQAPPAEAAALFCSLVTGRGYPEFVQRCEDQGGTSQPCYDPVPGASCSASLAEAGIICPTAPGAPAATAWGLGALALALTALGARAARRRTR